MSQRRDLKIDWIRGNVDTRIRKVRERLYDGTIIAEAGVARLGLATGKEQRLPISKFPTSPGQGAIGVYARAPDRSILERVREANSDAHMREVLAEGVSGEGGGGCVAPLGHCEVEGRMS